MTYWILAGLAVYFFGLFLPATLTFLTMGPVGYLGSRDVEPQKGVRHARAQRAHRNFLENIAPFLGLALLSLVVPTADGARALLGAQLFVLARIAFLPLYIFAVPVVRSGAFLVGFFGLILMALALI